MGAWPRSSSGRPVLLTITVPRLHAVTNDRVLSLEDFAARATVIARGASVALHVRSRDRTAAEQFHMTRRLVPLGTVIVNDRVDLAVAAAAAGVHLPAAGVPTATARALLGPSTLVGRSTHTPAEAVAACDDGADYVFLGPIWETSSHPGHPGLGIDAIRTARATRVIAIGGVTPDRVLPCLDAGAWGVAAITALWNVDDVAAAVDAFLLSLSS